jgi:hypothetical protein
MSYTIPNPSGATFGLRINNLFDLRPKKFTYDGQIGLTDGKQNYGSAIFDNLINGLRAGAMDLNIKIDKDGLNTITKISEVFAPTSDGNNPVEWAKNVSSVCGIGVNDILTTDDQTIGDLMYGVIFAEQGNAGLNAVNDSDINAAINAYNGGGYSSNGNTNKPTNTNGLITIILLLAGGFIAYKYAIKKNF